MEEVGHPIMVGKKALAAVKVSISTRTNTNIDIGKAKAVDRGKLNVRNTVIFKVGWIKARPQLKPRPRTALIHKRCVRTACNQHSDYRAFLAMG